MSSPKSQNGKDKSNFQILESDIDSKATLLDIAKEPTSLKNEQIDHQGIGVPQLLPLETETHKSSHSESAEEKRGELISSNTKLPEKRQETSIFQHLKAKTVASLVGTAVMLPILGVGTATYYFGSQAIDKQAIWAKRVDNIGLVETELARQQKLLAALLIGTGTTALLAGIVAVFGTKRLIDSISLKTSTETTQDESETQLYQEFIQHINHSVSQEDILKAIVEEARNYLNCDRVVVYSLNQDNHGVVVAESVASGWTKALNKTISDPCFEARYLDKYRDGRVRALDNIYEAEITPCYLEQLEQLEVKANLITPILNKGKLFGLLVAHQCSESRQWKNAEIEFLNQLAKKVGLALDHAKLLGDLARLQIQAEKERKWTNYFTDATQYIRQSLKQDDVLEISVEEVRRVLECDRVVVYSLNQDRYGVVIAESVVPGYPRALNQTISDPCFEARYLDKYRDGRVRAINNLQEAGLTQCYLEQLESLEVKANLVTPILNEGKLFGLLVAHQCSQPRNWQEYEIRWVTQIATQVGFALDNAKVLVESTTQQAQAEKERKWTNYFTDATQYIRQSLKQDDVLEISVEEVRRVLECDRVVVYSLNQDRYGVVIAESVVPGYPRALNQTISDPCFEARYLDKYRDGRVRAINNLQEAGLTQCYLEQLESLEVKANLVTPILNEGKLFGLLVAHQCSQPRNWQEYEIRWVTQIATQVGFALDNAKVLVESTTQQAQAEKERKWTNYFTDATQYIRQSLKQDDVLEISVEEVRRVLECDRVVVYSLNQDRYGVVIAESVVPGYPRALNQTISDPCFEARYLDKYRDGRVRAINNLQEAGLTQCYLEQLESLEVKANLVTPILNEGKLFGLLVAHQCSQPRNWQEYEIRWVTQIATQVGFALDNAELLRRLKNEGVPTQLLKSFTLGIGERLNEAELLKTAVEQARKVMGLDRAIVYQFDANYYGTVIAESVVPGYPRALNSKIKDPCFARDYAEKYRQGRIKAISDVHQAGLTDCHLEQLASFGVKASLVAPILQDNRLFGLLIGHQCSEPHSWEQSEIDLFAQLALQLELALDRARLREELTQAQLTSRNIAKEQQLKQQSFEQQISELLQENQVALQNLKAKINYQSAATSIFLERIEAASDEVKSIATGYPTKLLARETAQIESLMREITIEANEVAFKPTKNLDSEKNAIAGEIIQETESAPSLMLMNQFVEEIANLSGQISQQSLVVTDSFKKLAAFTQELSIDKKDESSAS